MQEDPPSGFWGFVALSHLSEKSLPVRKSVSQVVFTCEDVRRIRNLARNEVDLMFDFRDTSLNTDSFPCCLLFGFGGKWVFLSSLQTCLWGPQSLEAAGDWAVGPSGRNHPSACKAEGGQRFSLRPPHPRHVPVQCLVSHRARAISTPCSFSCWCLGRAVTPTTADLCV